MAFTLQKVRGPRFKSHVSPLVCIKYKSHAFLVIYHLGNASKYHRYFWFVYEKCLINQVWFDKRDLIFCNVPTSKWNNLVSICGGNPCDAHIWFGLQKHHGPLYRLLISVSATLRDFSHPQRKLHSSRGGGPQRTAPPGRAPHPGPILRRGSVVDSPLCEERGRGRAGRGWTGPDRWTGKENRGEEGRRGREVLGGRRMRERHMGGEKGSGPSDCFCSTSVREKNIKVLNRISCVGTSVSFCLLHMIKTHLFVRNKYVFDEPEIVWAVFELDSQLWYLLSYHCI